MSNRILVFYGSYRSDRMGIRLAKFVVERLRRRRDHVELIDAKAINLPMLDRMYKEYPKGEAPAVLEQLAQKIRGADGFVFVTGEYNWGVQPGLKNLTDHFLEEWFWRPAAIVSYSAGRLSGARAATAWHGTLSEMGMVVISSTIAVGLIGQTLSAEGEPTGDSGKHLRAHSRASLTISCGGSKRQRRSGSTSSRRIDREHVYVVVGSHSAETGIMSLQPYWCSRIDPDQCISARLANVLAHARSQALSGAANARPLTAPPPAGISPTLRREVVSAFHTARQRAGLSPRVATRGAAPPPCSQHGAGWRPPRALLR